MVVWGGYSSERWDRLVYLTDKNGPCWPAPGVHVSARGLPDAGELQVVGSELLQTLAAVALGA